MAGFADIAAKAAAADKAKQNGSAAAPAADADATETVALSPSSPKRSNNDEKKKKVLSAFSRSPKASKPSSQVASVATNAAENDQNTTPPLEKQGSKINSADANWSKVTTAVKVTAVADKNRRAKESQKLADRKLVSAVSWDIWSPPPSNSLKGKITPRMLNKYQNRRKISLEVHQVTPLIEEQDETKTNESIFSALTGTGSKPSSSISPSSKSTKKKALHSYEECVCR
jgi:hypothetical protein